MSDILLFWWGIDASKVIAPRSDVADLVTHLNLGEVHDISLQSFRSAARATTVRYGDAAGTSHTLHADLTRRTPQFTTAKVMREDGLPVAEWKFFPARRTSAGQVPGSHDIRHLIRAGLEDSDAHAARKWIAQAEQCYQRVREEPPASVVRRLLREASLQVGVPIHGRGALYFGYDDDRAAFEQLQTFLEGTTQDPIHGLVPIEDGSNYAPFVTSADIYLSQIVQDILTPPKTPQRPPSLATQVDTISWVRSQLQRHERRLRAQLPRTGEVLPLADRWVQDQVSG